MQVHGPSDTITANVITTRINPGAHGPFAVITIGHVELYIRDTTECDALIRAAAAAKAELLAAELPGTWCPAFTVMDYEGITLYCDRHPGHEGSHHAPGPDEGSEVAWGDEDAYPDVSGAGVPYAPGGETAYVDNPTPHSDDCDCEGCVTFYAERNRA